MEYPNVRTPENVPSVELGIVKLFAFCTQYQRTIYSMYGGRIVITWLFSEHKIGTFSTGKYNEKGRTVEPVI